MNQSTQQSAESIRFRLRSDLVFADYAAGVGSQIVVKDPLKLEYYLFDSFEKTLLTLLRRPLSAADLKILADKQLAPGFVDASEIQKFLQRLMRDNLVLADKQGIGHSLWKTYRQTGRQQWLQKLSGILAIRFRGVNPQAMLDVVNPFTKFLFHPFFVGVATLMFTTAVIVVALNTSRIFQSDYLWQNLADPRTVVAIILATIIVKLLHELGHALACSSIGRDCHEMGFMLLAFVPCLYCNVSDVWMEPNRWKRMMVSGAGIYVEMLIAVVCVPLWLLSHDGPVQAFWFAMLTICSVNTLFINGNPLLRYDGYYLLSDWLEMPNLSAQSQKSVADRVRRFFLKSTEPLPAVGFLELYGVASKVYRILILAFIVLAIYAVFERMELPQLGLIISLVLLSLTFGTGVSRGIRTFCNREFAGAIRIGRSIVFLVLLLLLTVLLLNLPVTVRVFANGETALREKGIVYAPHAGQINWLVPPGNQVVENQVIAVVKSESLEQEVMRQKQLRAEIEMALENQIILQRQGAENSREIELQKDALDSARKIETQLLARIDRLQVRAAVSGTLASLPGAVIADNDPLNLKRESSTLLSENRGCSVARGEPIAVILNADESVVRLRVDEKKIKRVSEGQQVKLLISQSSPDFVFGSVMQIAIDKSDLPARQTGENPAPQQQSVEVVVKLNQANAENFFQSRVRAAIIGKRVPWYEYVWQLITENIDA